MLWRALCVVAGRMQWVSGQASRHRLLGGIERHLEVLGWARTGQRAASGIEWDDQTCADSLGPGTCRCWSGRGGQRTDVCVRRYRAWHWWCCGGGVLGALLATHPLTGVVVPRDAAGAVVLVGGRLSSWRRHRFL